MKVYGLQNASTNLNIVWYGLICINPNVLT